MGVFFICPRAAPTLPERLSRVQHCIWLGSLMAVPSGHNTAMGEWPGSAYRGPQLQLGLFHIQSGIYNLSGNARERITWVAFLFIPEQRLLSRSASAEYASTWSGEPASAASERPGELMAKRLVSSYAF